MAAAAERNSAPSFPAIEETFPSTSIEMGEVSSLTQDLPAPNSALHTLDSEDCRQIDPSSLLLEEAPGSCLHLIHQGASDEMEMKKTCYTAPTQHVYNP